MAQQQSTARRALDVGIRFFVLGCLSFGGPAAHLGYFRRAFVQRLGWLDDDGYARLVALAQFLPGPASSQVGFAIGLQRAGLIGGLAAFVGFTLPSFTLMTALAIGSRSWLDQAWLPGVIGGLKWLALVVVADAVIGLFLSFCRRTLTQSIALITAAAVLLLPWVWAQPLLLLIMALVGARFLVADSIPLQLFGYASAQAMPGPLFTLAAFLGAQLQPAQPWLGAAVATLTIFLPGFLLLLAVADIWQRLAQRPRLAGALTGINAAVVGLLLAALYQPVFVSAIDGATALALALLALVALRFLRCPVLVLVATAIVLGYLGWV